VHATTRLVPAEQLYETGAMAALPPVLADPSFRTRTRLPRDHYVRLETNDYSVHPRCRGRLVDLRADLNSVVVTADRTDFISCAASPP
jgi:hypothetical protein